MIRVLIDTREQLPFTFKEAKVSHVALDEGDYQLYGDKTGLCIERKSVEDLFGTVTKGRERFTHELERLSRNHSFPVLLVEGTAGMVKLGASYSQANGSRVLDHTLALCIAYGVAPVFCAGRGEANEMAWRMLKARAETKHKGMA